MATSSDGAGRERETDATRPVTRVHDDTNPMNWLLLVPIVLCLIVPFYNRTEPVLFGIPFFYWYQLAVIPVGVVCTLVVYRSSTRRSGGR